MSLQAEVEDLEFDSSAPWIEAGKFTKSWSLGSRFLEAFGSLGPSSTGLNSLSNAAIFIWCLGPGVWRWFHIDRRDRWCLEGGDGKSLHGPGHELNHFDQQEGWVQASFAHIDHFQSPQLTVVFLQIERRAAASTGIKNRYERTYWDGRVTHQSKTLSFRSESLKFACNWLWTNQILKFHPKTNVKCQLGGERPLDLTPFWYISLCSMQCQEAL